jgi:hypothetical protein
MSRITAVPLANHRGQWIPQTGDTSLKYDMLFRIRIPHWPSLRMSPCALLGLRVFLLLDLLIVPSRRPFSAPYLVLQVVSSGRVSPRLKASRIPERCPASATASVPVLNLNWHHHDNLCGLHEFGSLSLRPTNVY